MKALQYLDKIIHLPFCIPRISEAQRLNYLRNLLNGNDNSCRKTLTRLQTFLEVKQQTCKSSFDNVLCVCVDSVAFTFFLACMAFLPYQHPRFDLYDPDLIGRTRF